MTTQRRQPRWKTRHQNKINQEIEKFMQKGGSVDVCPTAYVPGNRLLFSSGHFHPKRSQRGSQPREQVSRELFQNDEMVDETEQMIAESKGEPWTKSNASTARTKNPPKKIRTKDAKSAVVIGSSFIVRRSRVDTNAGKDQGASRPMTGKFTTPSME